MPAPPEPRRLRQAMAPPIKGSPRSLLPAALHKPTAGARASLGYTGSACWGPRGSHGALPWHQCFLATRPSGCRGRAGLATLDTHTRAPWGKRDMCAGLATVAALRHSASPQHRAEAASHMPARHYAAAWGQPDAQRDRGPESRSRRAPGTVGPPCIRQVEGGHGLREPSLLEVTGPPLGLCHQPPVLPTPRRGGFGCWDARELRCPRVAAALYGTARWGGRPVVPKPHWYSISRGFYQVKWPFQRTGRASVEKGGSRVSHQGPPGARDAQPARVQGCSGGVGGGPGRKAAPACSPPGPGRRIRSWARTSSSPASGRAARSPSQTHVPHAGVPRGGVQCPGPRYDTCARLLWGRSTAQRLARPRMRRRRKPGPAGAPVRSRVLATTWGTGRLCTGHGEAGVTAARTRQGALVSPARPSAGRGATAALHLQGHGAWLAPGRAGRRSPGSSRGPGPGGALSWAFGSREQPRGRIPATNVAAKHCKAPDSPICVLPPKRENSLRRLPYLAGKFQTSLATAGLFSQQTATEPKIVLPATCGGGQANSSAWKPGPEPGAGPTAEDPAAPRSRGEARPRAKPPPSLLPTRTRARGWWAAATGARRRHLSLPQMGRKGKNGQAAGHRRLLPGERARWRVRPGPTRPRSSPRGAPRPPTPTPVPLSAGSLRLRTAKKPNRMITVDA